MINAYREFTRNMVEQALDFRAIGDVLPTWVIVDEFGNSQIIGTPWTNDEEKAISALHIAEFIVEAKAQTVIFVADVWTRHIRSEDIEKEAYKRPSQELDAIEAIAAQCWNADHTGFGIIQTYRQHDDGEIVKLDYIEDDHPSTESPTFSVVLQALYG